MSGTGPDSALASALELSRHHVLAPEAIHNQGAGMAYQLVAHAAALAVQDATDHLRNAGLLGATSTAVAAARMIETGDGAAWREVLQESQKIVDRAAETFHRIGLSAAEILRSFPPDTNPDRRTP